MIVKILNAYMSTVMGENIMPIVDVNQYDHDGKQIQILVRDMDISGMYAVVDGKKPDDTYVYNKTISDSNSVFVDITLQMTAVSGSYDMQVTLFDESDDSRAGIYKYTLRIAAATVPDPTVVSTDEYTALVTNAKEYDDAAAASAAAASASATAAESAQTAAETAQGKDLHSIMVGFNLCCLTRAGCKKEIYIPLWSDSIAAAASSLSFSFVFTFHYGRIQS